MSSLGSIRGHERYSVPRVTPTSTPPMVHFKPSSAVIPIGFCSIDVQTAVSFLLRLWEVIVVGVGLYYVANLSTIGDDNDISFRALTYLSLVLSFLSRTRLVDDVNIFAAAGVIGVSVVLSYWVTVAALGFEAFGGPSPIGRNLVIHVAIPVDAFAIALHRKAFASFLGVWYTVSIALLWVFLAISETPYPFLEDLKPEERTGVYIGGIFGAYVLHTLLVVVYRKRKGMSHDTN